MSKRWLAVFQIIRPLNCTISALSILIAALLASPQWLTLKVLVAMLSTALITAGANTINDYFDVEIDRINRPQRPLPAQRLTPGFAKVFAIILFGCGVFFSIFINIFAIIIALTSSLLLFIYSAKLKQTVLWGNATVSFMGGLAFVYGALAAGRWSEGIIPASFAFLFHFGREILKDMEDMQGDAVCKARTLPVQHGYRTALAATTGIYSLLIGATILPYRLGIYGLAYFITVLLGVDFVLLVVLLILWADPGKHRVGSVNQILKADMLVGLLAIYLGKAG